MDCLCNGIWMYINAKIHIFPVLLLIYCDRFRVESENSTAVPPIQECCLTVDPQTLSCRPHTCSLLGFSAIPIWYVFWPSINRNISWSAILKVKVISVWWHSCNWPTYYCKTQAVKVRELHHHDRKPNPHFTVDVNVFMVTWHAEGAHHFVASTDLRFGLLTFHRSVKVIPY